MSEQFYVLMSFLAAALLCALMFAVDRCDDRWTRDNAARREACVQTCGGAFLENVSGTYGCLCVSKPVGAP